jgi:hypothetical protein
VSQLAAAVCSITPTSRRRFFWAAWWTGAPTREPFRRPDASHGGATSREDALREAQKRAGRSLVEIEPRWARAWNRVLRELPPWTSRDAKDAENAPAKSRPPSAPTSSVFDLLGVDRRADLAELKRAYHARARETHPDRGGDAATFVALKAAYERATQRRAKNDRRPRGRAKPC